MAGELTPLVVTCAYKFGCLLYSLHQPNCLFSKREKLELPVMKIQDKFTKMDLDQLSKFLQKPIGVTFKKKGLQCPKITWVRHGYHGEILLQDLAKQVRVIYERDCQELPGKKFSPLQERMIRYYQIEKGRDLIKTIHSVQTHIQKMWWSHSYVSPIGVAIDKMRSRGAVDQTLNELLTSFAASLNADQRKLDQEAAKFNVRYVFNEYAGFFNDIFRSFSHSFHTHDFEPRPQGKPLSFNPYEVLGLSSDATPHDIKKKYHQLALKTHPDKNPQDPEAVANFQKLQKAYEVLSNQEKRARYDRFGVLD